MITGRETDVAARKKERTDALAELQAARPQPPIGDDLVKEFMVKLQSQAGIAQRIACIDDVPNYIKEIILRPENRKPSLAIGSDPSFAQIPWDGHADFNLVTAESIQHGGVAISRALVGVADTGSLVLCSGAENPTLLNFLPDHHVVVIRECDIVGSLENMWSVIREQYPEGFPRAINVISGPSATADVAVTFVYGVHGPTRLHALLVAE